MNYSLTATETSVDAFTSEVIRSAVVAITAEMKTNLQRTAYNQIIYEAEDFTVGLFDAEGITRDIYSEGIQLPFVKIYKAGRQDPELTSIIRANVRLPERAMGDFRAQIASIRTGERRLLQLLKRYGNQAFKESVALVFEQS